MMLFIPAGRFVVKPPVRLMKGARVRGSVPGVGLPAKLADRGGHDRVRQSPWVLVWSLVGLACWCGCGVTRTATMKASTRSRHRRGRAADVIIPPRLPCPADPMPRFLGTWPVPGSQGSAGCALRPAHGVKPQVLWRLVCLAAVVSDWGWLMVCCPTSSVSGAQAASCSAVATTGGVDILPRSLAA